MGLWVEREPIARGRAASAVGAVCRVLGWPGRIRRARRLMEVFAGMTETELRDIGLARIDLVDASALACGADPSEFLGRRAEERRRRGAGSGRTPGRIP